MLDRRRLLRAPRRLHPPAGAGVRPGLGLQGRDRQRARAATATTSPRWSCSRPTASTQKLRMPLDVYLGVVAATNMKQRTRKQIEYYHADRLNYAVIGTPNRLEYDQGFFVKNGDGAADVKPIAHLYKTPGLSARRASRRAGGDPPPSADHRHLVAGADAGGVLLLAALSTEMDLCLYGLEQRRRRRRRRRGRRAHAPSRSSASGATSPPSAGRRAICTSRRCWSSRCWRRRSPDGRDLPHPKPCRTARTC